MHLALRSALKAPLPLPGSYFSAPLAAPSSSGCFCGRGAVLETRLPFIALNVPRRSLSSAPPPPRTLLLAMAQQEGLRLFPTAFLQMVTPCLTAARVPGAPPSPAGGLLPFLCLAGFSAALRRGHGSISPQDTRRQRGLLQAQPCPSASPPLLGPELPQRAVRGLLQAHGCLLLPGWFRPGSSQSAGGRQSCGSIVTVRGEAGSCHHPVGTCRREHSP